jgi:hypothetical protein
MVKPWQCASTSRLQKNGRRQRRPLIDETCDKVTGVLAFTLMTNLSTKSIFPKVRFHHATFLCIAASWVGCGTRVSHFDRTGEFGDPFEILAHRSQLPKNTHEACQPI